MATAVRIPVNRTNVTNKPVVRLMPMVAAMMMVWTGGTVQAQQVLGLDDAFIQTLVPADANCCRLLAGDQLWVISSRQSFPVDDCADDGAFQDSASVEVQVMNFDGCCWRPSTWDALERECAAHPEMQTVVYVHGNFTDFGWSLRRGCQVYQNLFGDGCASGRLLCNDRGPTAPRWPRAPLRLILWSWQSEREALPPRDFWIKSARARREGARFNAVLRALKLERPVVVGYSLGVQVILAGLLEDNAAADHSPWRVALLAPVLEWTFPASLCQTESLAGRVEALTLVTNGRDRALKNANRAIRLRSGEIAFTQYDLAAALAQRVDHFRQYEISHEAGGRHAIVHYTGQPTVQYAVRELYLHSPPHSELTPREP